MNISTADTGTTQLACLGGEQGQGAVPLSYPDENSLDPEGPRRPTRVAPWLMGLTTPFACSRELLMPFASKRDRLDHGQGNAPTRQMSKSSLPHSPTFLYTHGVPCSARHTQSQVELQIGNRPPHVMSKYHEKFSNPRAVTSCIWGGDKSSQSLTLVLPRHPSTFPRPRETVPAIPYEILRLGPWLEAIDATGLR